MDFNNCGKIELNKAGLEKAAAEFMRNDPYYPRPIEDRNHADFELWEVFMHTYLRVGGRILGNASAGDFSPHMFIRRIMALQQGRVEKEAKMEAAFSKLRTT